MSKMRIYELAKQIDKDSAEIVALLKDKGVDVKNHMSSIDDDAIDLVKSAFGGKKAEAPKKADKPAAKAESPKKEESKKADKPVAKAEAPKKEEPKKEAAKAEEPKKADKPEAKKEQPKASNNNQNNNSNKKNNQNNQNNQKQNGGQNNQGEKKKHITQVFNPQNSAQNDRNKNNNNNKNNKNNNTNNNKNNNFGNNGFNKNGKNNNKPKQQPVKPEPKEEEIKVITLPDFLTIKELADKMKLQASALIKKLFMQGQMYSINQEIDYETAEQIALEYDIIAEPEEKVDVIEELLREEAEDESTMTKRPPVVCVMGHVDHGKTSLLDAIRSAKVVSGEAGGITQHIGAYMVKCNGEDITFLDTPGHEAFTAMRMRGAQSTDIAVLVVAADDGVMPQTVEAINHAKAAGVSIIVAVNKIDKPSANVDKVKQELAEYELVAEDWGGDTVFVPVSAHTKEGIDQLLEMILLTSEMLELKANANRKARGLVLEAKLDKGRGPVATVLVQKGTLKVGDIVAVGSSYGRIRAMISDTGERVQVATPSTPVEILGLNSVPNAGEIFVSTKNEKEARNFADTFIAEGKEKLIENAKAKNRMSLDDLFTQMQTGDVKELNIIVKADVQGSVEAVKQSLVKLSNEEVVVKIIHGGVGAINESDVILASASNAIIIGFNVRLDNMAKDTADREGVDVRLYRVIYQAIEDVQAAMKGMLDPVFEEKVIGHAEIRQLFKASGIGTIAGSFVLDGTFQRGCSVRVMREGSVIFEGPLASLKRFKDDVKEVRAGYECGFVFEGFNDFQELDTVEAYIMVEVPR
ncbi:MAG: translation initiation factor IF-2 [Lachnospiraceae bacterium]|nr:translation initiation factor IF-2 [Lachnospiraceae bacterium]